MRIKALKIKDAVMIKSSGITGEIIAKNGETIHVRTPDGDIIKTVTTAVQVLGLIDRILASLVQILLYFKTPKN